jgi:hypothetical protein
MIAKRVAQRLHLRCFVINDQYARSECVGQVRLPYISSQTVQLTAGPQC